MPQTRAGLVDEFFDAAPIGLAILRLDDPADAGSFRVLHVNRMAANVGTVPRWRCSGGRDTGRWQEGT